MVKKKIGYILLSVCFVVCSFLAFFGGIFRKNKITASAYVFPAVDTLRSTEFVHRSPSDVWCWDIDRNFLNFYFEPYEVLFNGYRMPNHSFYFDDSRVEYYFDSDQFGNSDFSFYSSQYHYLTLSLYADGGGWISIIGFEYYGNTGDMYFTLPDRTTFQVLDNGIWLYEFVDLIYFSNLTIGNPGALHSLPFDLLLQYGHFEFTYESALMAFNHLYDYSLGYTDGYYVGLEAGYGLPTASDVIGDFVDSFLLIEVFPDFPIYNLFILAFGGMLVALFVKIFL